MLTLILMRHAKSSWDHPGKPDHDRPLNGRGRRSAALMGDWLRTNGHVPDVVLSSSSRRTMETFEGLALECPVHFTRSLYHAGPGSILGELRAATANKVLVLCHNPGIAEFADRILETAPDHPRFWDYPTCATLVARFDATSWKDVDWETGRAVNFAIPRDLDGGAG